MINIYKSQCISKVIRFDAKPKKLSVFIRKKYKVKLSSYMIYEKTLQTYPEFKKKYVKMNKSKNYTLILLEVKKSLINCNPFLKLIRVSYL